MFRRTQHSVLPITSAILIGIVILLTFTPTALGCWVFCWGCYTTGCTDPHTGDDLPEGTPCRPGGFFCPGWACTCGPGTYGVWMCLEVGD